MDVRSEPRAERFRRHGLRIDRCDGRVSGSVCNIVEHDPVTHGLKRCNTVSAKEAFLLADDRHYEMLLRADPNGPGAHSVSGDRPAVSAK